MSAKIASLYAQLTLNDGMTPKLKGVKDGLAAAGIAVAAVAAAAMLLKKGLNETVGVFVNYAGQVRTISQVTGESAESVSRLLQVTDDYKISSDALTVVMKKMATEGFSFTTDSIADLSDEYLKLNPGVERQIFLNEKFGKQGVAFAEIMLAGGEAIRNQSGAVAEGLILTQAALQKARDYEIAQDNLNDSWMAAKIAIGEMIVPMLNTAMSYQTAKLRADELGISMQTYVNGETGLKSILPLEKTHAQLLDDIAEAERGAAEKGAELQTQIELEDGAFFRFIPTLDAVAASTGDITGESDALITSLGNLSQSWQDVGWNALIAKAAQDGVITEEEMTLLGNYATSMGIMSEAERVAWEQALNLTNALNNMPKNIDIFITEWVIQQTRTMAPSGGPPDNSGDWEWNGTKWIRGASGLNFTVPPGYPNDSYGIRVQSGEHVAVTPANQVANAQPARSGPMDISDKSVRALADALFYRLQAVL